MITMAEWQCNGAHETISRIVVDGNKMIIFPFASDRRIPFPKGEKGFAFKIADLMRGVRGVSRASVVTTDPDGAKDSVEVTFEGDAPSAQALRDSIERLVSTTENPDLLRRTTPLAIFNALGITPSLARGTLEGGEIDSIRGL